MVLRSSEPWLISAAQLHETGCFFCSEVGWLPVKAIGFLHHIFNGHITFLTMLRKFLEELILWQIFQGGKPLRPEGVNTKQLMPA